MSTHTYTHTHTHTQDVMVLRMCMIEVEVGCTSLLPALPEKVWRFHCIYMHAYIRLVGLTVSHHPHFSMFLFSGSTVAWYIPWSVKWNSVLIQLNWGLVHSIYYVPNVVAPAIVMHWQLPNLLCVVCCLYTMHC